MKKVIFYFIALITIVSCKLNNDEIQKLGWKYGGGYHIGDVISFKNNFSLKNDTIYFNKSAKAKIIASRKRVDGSEVLKIKSLTSEEEGTYYAKW
jgi:hypothetical protein